MPSNDPSTSSQKPKTFLAVALCDLAMMSLAIGVNLLPVFLTRLAGDLGVGGARLSGEQLGRIGAVTFTGLVIGIVVAGPLADRLGGRLFAVGGNALLAAGLGLLGITYSYDLLLIAAFVMGVGAGALDMILSPIVAALQPERRTVAMNLLHSFYCAGAVMTILVGAVALRWGVDWRSVAVGLMFMPMLIGVAFVFVKLPPLVHEDFERMPLRQLFAERFFVVALIAIFLGGSTELGIAYWLSAYAEKTLGYPKFTADMAFLGFSVAMAVGRAGILFLPKSVGPVPLMLACCIASVVLFPLAAFAPSNAVALSCCILAGLAGSCLWPSTLAVTADRFPHGGATMFALLAAFGNFGGIFMPWLAGFVADRSSMRWGIITATICPVLMIVCLLWMWKRTGNKPTAISPVLAASDL